MAVWKEWVSIKILIDEIKLNLLLEKKKQFIGNNVVWDSVLSAVSFLISVILASYKDFFGIPGIVLKTVFVVLGILFTGKSIIDIVANKLIRDKNEYEKMSRAINPYGDGNASKRIVDNILYYFNLKENRAEDYKYE